MSPADTAGSMRSDISESAGPIDELIQRLTPPPLSPASSSSARGRTTPSTTRPILHASPGRPLSDHHHVVQTRRSSYGVSSSDSHNGSPSASPAAPPVLPEVRIIRPSLPPGSNTQEDSRDSFEVRPIDIEGVSLPRAADGSTGSPSGSPSRTGRQQKQRRNVVGPSGILNKIRSRASLRELRHERAVLATPPKTTLGASVPSPTGSPSQISTSATSPKTTFLRPAPPVPDTTPRRASYFAFSSVPGTSPSPAASTHDLGNEKTAHVREYALPSPAAIGVARGISRRGMSEATDATLVEIPRFKKRPLNLGIVHSGGPTQRLAWYALWFFWLANSLLSVFFDVNVIYMITLCRSSPYLNSGSAQGWTFALVAYALCWAISFLVVWLGWELYYEFWRRWRLDRPAIEPIHLSLPASLHLSLLSFSHFNFLLHIRKSPLDTAFRRDVLPETAHALLQLGPGFIPIMPRAAIALVLLVAFSSPPSNETSPPIVDRHGDGFFRTNGALTNYARGVLFAFVIWAGVRLLVFLGSAVTIWAFSDRPFGPFTPARYQASASYAATTTPRQRRTSYPARDPANTLSPEKGWMNENQFDWAWKDRTRARIQDAFELCMIRGSSKGSTDPVLAHVLEGGLLTSDIFAPQSEPSYHGTFGRVSATQLGQPLMTALGGGGYSSGTAHPAGLSATPVPGSVRISVDSNAHDPFRRMSPGQRHLPLARTSIVVPTSPPRMSRTLSGVDAPRSPSPEDRMAGKRDSANTASSGRSEPTPPALDLFYTPAQSRAPTIERDGASIPDAPVSVGTGVEEFPTPRAADTGASRINRHEAV